MKQRLARFFSGRYGSYGGDEFSRFLSIVSWVPIILGFVVLLIGLDFGWIFYIIALLLMGYSLFRLLSKNINKRRGENVVFLRKKNAVKGFFSGIRQRIEQRKTHRFYKCPQCHVTTRVPKGKGKIRITCPKCHMTFIRKS